MLSEVFVNPVKTILSGSRALRTLFSDSDLDMLVVLDEPGIPVALAENGRLYRWVSKPLWDV